jgi:hypothetical protein
MVGYRFIMEVNDSGLAVRAHKVMSGRDVGQGRAAGDVNKIREDNGD